MEIDIKFILNQKLISNKLNSSTVLLDYLRKTEKLTGTKEVCKEGDCGACAVLIGDISNNNISYKVINSCLYPIQKIDGKHIITIEGLSYSDELNPIQAAFASEGASQCGFCTPGFIISFTGYLLNNSVFDTEEAINAIAGNICRCTGYHSIIRSINNYGRAHKNMSLENLISDGVIPNYFREIPKKLAEINIINSPERKVFTQVVSGGTDLYVQKPDDLLDTDTEISENLIHPNIKVTDGKIIISGSATIGELEKTLNNTHTDLKLDKLFRLFASQPIRNSATIAGNIINASPIADITISLLALNAILVMRDIKNRQRNVELRDFYLGYKTFDKSEEELLEEIHFTIPEKNSVFNFEKVSKRKHLDIASVNTAFNLKFEKNKVLKASISAGGVAPIPLYLSKTSIFLAEKEINDKLVIDAVEIAKSEIIPISDIRGSKEYKTLLLSQLIKAHFIELFPEYISTEVIKC